MKKFWKTIEIKKVSSKEFYILLDNKKLKTPLKNELILSNHLMAKEVLKEWDQSSDSALRRFVVDVAGIHISEPVLERDIAGAN